MVTLTIGSAQGLRPGGTVAVYATSEGGPAIQTVRDNSNGDLDPNPGSITIAVGDELRRTLVVDNDGKRTVADPRLFWEQGSGKGATPIVPQVLVPLPMASSGTVELRELKGIFNGTPWQTVNVKQPGPGNAQIWLPRGWKGVATVITPTGKRSSNLIQVSANGINTSIRSVSSIQPTPVTKLNVSSFYVPGTNTIDQKKYQEYLAKTQPMFDLMGLCGLAADPETSSAELVTAGVNGLLAWVRAKALMWDKTPTANPQHMRAWTLSSLAQSYQKLRSHMSVENQLLVEKWLAQSLDKAYAHFLPAGPIRSVPAKPQNLLQWFGTAAAAVSSVISAANTQLAPLKLKFRTAAVSIFTKSIQSIDANGYLPSELTRGPRSLFYSTFSLTALTASARLLASPGFDPWSLNNLGLKRAALRTLAGIKNPTGFAGAAMPKLVAQLPVDLRDQAWLHRLPASYGINPGTAERYHRYLGAN
jgi:Alginate lyase